MTDLKAAKKLPRVAAAAETLSPPSFLFCIFCISTRHHLIVYMHHSEAGRASNSGCLLPAVLGDKASILIKARARAPSRSGPSFTPNSRRSR